MPHTFSNNHTNNLGTLVFTQAFQKWVESWPSVKPFVLECLASHSDKMADGSDQSYRTHYDKAVDAWTTVWRSHNEDADGNPIIWQEFNIKTAPSPIGVATTICFPSED